MHVLPSCDAGLYCRKGGIFYPHAPLTLTSILSYPTYPAPMHFREDGAFYAAPAPQHTLIQGHSLPGGLGGTSLFQSWARARAHTHTCTHTHTHTHTHMHTHAHAHAHAHGQFCRRAHSHAHVPLACLVSRLSPRCLVSHLPLPLTCLVSRPSAWCSAPPSVPAPAWCPAPPSPPLLPLPLIMYGSETWCKTEAQGGGRARHPKEER